VVDISDKDYRFKAKEVMKLIDELGLSDIPILKVNNKSDKANLSNLDELSASKANQVWISAQKEEGFDGLIHSINRSLYGKEQKEWVSLFPELGWLRAKLYSSGSVIEERTSDSGLIQLHFRKNII
jgi:50S ribosomal subunit-associated GTPase HflX